MSKTGEFQNEGINRYRDSVCFHESAFPGWHECVGCCMKQITESDRIAARLLAKRLVAELGKMEWHRRGNEAECARRVSEAVNREARNNGLSPLLIKSFMLRLQDGRV